MKRFKKGDIVTVGIGHPIWANDGSGSKEIDISPELVSKEAVVEYEYSEKYGGSWHDSYSLDFGKGKGGRRSWFHPKENKMKLIRRPK